MECQGTEVDGFDWTSEHDLRNLCWWVWHFGRGSAKASGVADSFCFTRNGKTGEENSETSRARLSSSVSSSLAQPTLNSKADYSTMQATMSEQCKEENDVQGEQAIDNSLSYEYLIFIFAILQEECTRKENTASLKTMHLSTQLQHARQ